MCEQDLLSCTRDDLNDDIGSRAARGSRLAIDCQSFGQHDRLLRTVQARLASCGVYVALIEE